MNDWLYVALTCAINTKLESVCATKISEESLSYYKFNVHLGKQVELI